MVKGGVRVHGVRDDEDLQEKKNLKFYKKLYSALLEEILV
jgi:hypothetical protein